MRQNKTSEKREKCNKKKKQNNIFIKIERMMYLYILYTNYCITFIIVETKTIHILWLLDFCHYEITILPGDLSNKFNRTLH